MRARLGFQVFVIEAKKMMSYRVDFWINVIGGLLAGIGVPYFMWRWIYDIRADGAGEIGGYGFPAMVTYYVCAALVMKVVRGNDLPMTVATDIYEGGLNRYLVYPTSYLPFKYLQQLGALVPCLVQLVVFGVLFLVVLGVPAGIAITPGTVAMALISMLVGNLLYFLIAYPLQLVSFWADNVWSLLVILRFVSGLLGGLMLPLSLFPEWSQSWLACTPFPSLFSVPIRTLTGELGVAEWAGQLGIALLWCGFAHLVTRAVWSRGQLRYTGVGI